MGNKNSGRHKGFKHSKEARIKMSKNHADYSGKNNPNFGGNFYGIRKIMNWTGENNPNWKDGRTPLILRIYDSYAYKRWRATVYQKDNYTCQKCGKRGGDFEAHHIKLFIEIFQEFLKEYKQFSPIEDKETLVRLAIKYKPFWDVNNGKTLHKDCHLKVHPKKRGKSGKFQKNLLV